MKIKKLLTIMLTLAMVTTVAFTLTACFENNNNGTGNYFERAQEALEEAGIAVFVTTREELEQNLGADMPVGLVRQLIARADLSLAIIEFDSEANAILATTLPRGDGEMRRNGVIVYIGIGQAFEIARNIIGGTIVP